MTLSRPSAGYLWTDAPLIHYFKSIQGNFVSRFTMETAGMIMWRIK